MAGRESSPMLKPEEIGPRARVIGFCLVISTCICVALIGVIHLVVLNGRPLVNGIVEVAPHVTVSGIVTAFASASALVGMPAYLRSTIQKKVITLRGITPDVA